MVLTQGGEISRQLQPENALHYDNSGCNLRVNDLSGRDTSRQGLNSGVTKRLFWPFPKVGTHHDLQYPAALHLRQKSIISSSPTSAPAVGAPNTDSQCLPVSELLIISTLATAKPRAELEPEPEPDSKHFDTFGAPLVPYH
jgi:hypothetical protein